MINVNQNKNLKNMITVVLTFILLNSIKLTRAHNEDPVGDTLETAASVDGLYSKVFIGAGITIFLIILVSAIWLLRRDKLEIDDPSTYSEKINSFSANARLYILHIQGMSLTYGVRTLLFNIYLLYIFRHGVNFFGYDFNAVFFIGFLLALGSIISGLMSPFNGIVVDKLGKKWSFIMGDFLGAMMILLVIFVQIPTVVIFAQIFRSAVMSIHGIAEGPFIYEQSTEKERVHLFSVSAGMSTLASMSGSLMGGVVPLAIAVLLYNVTTVSGSATIFVLQVGLFVSVLMWLGSLIPAFFLKEDPELYEQNNQHSVSAKLSFKNVTNWNTIGIFVLSALLIGFGAGMFVQFFSVFFLIFFEASPAEIAIIFALGSLFVAVGNFVSPILADRYGKVNTIVSTRIVGSMFIFLLPVSPTLGIAGLVFLFRGMFFNSTMPTESALAMETVLDAERTTLEALRMGASSIFSAVGFLIGGYLMGQGIFTTPFYIAGSFYLLATIIFWLYFRGNKVSHLINQNQKIVVPQIGD